MSGPMNSLDEYIASESVTSKAKKAIAASFGISPEDFDEVIDSRHEWWCIENDETLDMGFAKSKEMLLEAVKISQSPGDRMGVRRYPDGYSVDRLTCDLPDNERIIRVGELVGLMFEDNQRFTLMVVRADREVKL